ncbi:MAG TPA: MFS transporter [Euzebyales bacterium]|nr:MFS transporter [Euzebyales bacterium]
MLIAATLSSTVAFIPPFLLGALAVPIRRELDFSDARLGVAVSVFFLTGALGSVHAGRLAERTGSRRGMAISAWAAAALLIVLAVAAQSWWSLVACLALAGLVNALAQPAADLALARGIADHQQGTAFGLRTGAVPVATLLAGLAVPAIGLTVGWRWAFVSAALLAVLYWLAAIGLDSGFDPPRHTNGEPLPMMPLVVLAVSIGLGIGLQHAVSAFYVSSAVALGRSEASAGIWLAIGALSAGLGRALGGWLIDVTGRLSPPMIAALMLLGAAATATLGLHGGTVGLLLSTVGAFAAGSGWNPLKVLMVVRAVPRAPAAAMGVVMVGAFGGGVLGPAGFGLLVERVGYRAAWPIAASCLVAAAALVLYAGPRLQRTQVAAAAVPGRGAAMLEGAQRDD